MKPLTMLFMIAAAALKADMTLATFEKGLNTEAAGMNIEYFSDKDESSAGKTQVNGLAQDGGYKGKAFRLRFKIAPNPTLGYQYAGFAIPLGQKSIASFAMLNFYLRGNGGPVPPMIIGLKSKANDRDKVMLSNYVKALPANTWVKVGIPMGDFKVMRTAAMLESMDSIAFSSESGEGVIDIDEVTLSGARSGMQASLEKPSPLVRPIWRKG